MNKLLFNHKNIVSLTFVGILSAIFIVCLKVNINDQISLENAYLYVRDGYIILKNREYHADAIFCTLHLSLFLPFITRIFKNDRDIDVSYIFVRIKNISKWYIIKTIQSAFYCLYSSVMYNIVIYFMLNIMNFKIENLSISISYLINGIIAGFLILFIFVILSNNISMLVGTHIGVTAVIVLITLSVVALCFSTYKQMQYNILLTYFISWHTNSSINFSMLNYSSWIYYAFSIFAVIIQIIIGRQIVKKIDIV